MEIPTIVGAGLIVIGASLGIGRIGSSAMDAIARQPEAAGKIQTAMLIIGALLEGLAFGAFSVFWTVLAFRPQALSHRSC